MQTKLNKNNAALLGHQEPTRSNIITKQNFQMEDNRPFVVAQKKIQHSIYNGQRTLQEKLINFLPLERQSNASRNPIQGVFIGIVGEEVPSGSTTLADGAASLMEMYNEDVFYTEQQILSDDFKSPQRDEIIYLIAHGDNPAITLTKEAALGEKNGVQVKNIVRKIVSKFTKENKKEQFAGKIILEGCHTAEPVIDSSQKVKKGSLLYDFQQAMLEDSFFKKNMAAETMIGGYLGQAFSTTDTETGYGTANTEHPLTKRFQKERGNKGTTMDDGSVSYDEFESFLESRWRKQLEFGNAGKKK